MIDDKSKTFYPGVPIKLDPDLEIRKLQIDICNALIDTLRVINQPIYIKEIRHEK